MSDMAPCNDCGGSRELRKRKRFSTIDVVTQCTSCGATAKVSKFDLLAIDIDTLGSLRFVDQKPKKRPNSKRRRFAAYFQTPQWKKKRDAVLARDNFECRLGYEGICEEVATTAHHLTYDRFENELLTDLVAACKRCNSEEPSRRPASRARR